MEQPNPDSVRQAQQLAAVRDHRHAAREYAREADLLEQEAARLRRAQRQAELAAATLEASL